MPPEIQAFAAGFPLVLAHAGISLAFLALGAAVYAFLSPHREIALIREGNAAAALSLGGVVAGLAIPLAAALTTAASLIEVALWGLVLVVIVLFVFRLLDFLLAGLPQRIAENDVPAAGLLVAARLSFALILAAAVVG